MKRINENRKLMYRYAPIYIYIYMHSFKVISFLIIFAIYKSITRITSKYNQVEKFNEDIILISVTIMLILCFFLIFIN